MKNYDVIIIGAGAAGLMCAATAGKRGRKVLLIDHAQKPGEKIRISGGGRCNFTNIHTTAKNFISQNPHFAVSALQRFTAQDFIEMVKKHNISFHEKTLGQLFCDFSSQQIIDMLLTECKDGGVDILLETEVKNIEKINDATHNFILKIKNKAAEALPQLISCQSLIIATGGLSIPKMGATGFGYDVARKFGLKIIDTYPALVPLTLDKSLLEATKLLAGVSVNAEVRRVPAFVGTQFIASAAHEISQVSGRDKSRPYKSAEGSVFTAPSFREAILFTHRGLSGPAILQISSYLKKGDEVIINMAPTHNIYEIFLAEKQQKPKQEIATILAKYLPKSLANYIAQTHAAQGWIADLSNQKLKEIATNINAWTLTPEGTEGYAKAEVTAGGLDTNEISSKTFECKSVKSLYFIGEVLDVTGHLGGFNFQFAWSSGHAAGQFA